MLDFNVINAAMARGIIVATIATVLAGGAAMAQTANAPALDAVRTDTMPSAPADERQPRRVQLPSKVRNEENSALSSERGFDQQLRICRGC
jgi:hypothetical protein